MFTPRTLIQNFSHTYSTADLNEAAHNALDNPMYDSYNSIKRSLETNVDGADMEHELINPLYVDTEDCMLPPLETIHEDVEREVLNPLYSDSKNLQMSEETFTDHVNVISLPDITGDHGCDDKENEKDNEVGYNNQFSDLGVTKRENTAKPVLYKRRSNSPRLPTSDKDDILDQEDEWRRKPMLLPGNSSTEQQESEEESSDDEVVYSEVREVINKERKTPALPPKPPNSQSSQSRTIHANNNSLATTAMEKETMEPVLPPRSPNSQPSQNKTVHEDKNRSSTSTMEKKTKKSTIPSKQKQKPQSLGQQRREQPNLNEEGNYSKLQHFHPATQNVIHSDSHEHNGLTETEGERDNSKPMLLVNNPDSQWLVMNDDGHNDNRVYNKLYFESSTTSLQADKGSQLLTTTDPSSQGQQSQTKTNRKVVLQSITEEGKKPMLPPKVCKKEKEEKPMQTKTVAIQSPQSAIDKGAMSTKPRDNSPSCGEGNYSTLQHFHSAIHGTKLSVTEDSGEYSQIHYDH